METVKSKNAGSGNENEDKYEGSEFEEIYLERARYLLNVDSLLEELLSENTDIENNAEEIGRSFLNESNTVLENIEVEADIPISVQSEFDNIIL